MPQIKIPPAVMQQMLAAAGQSAGPSVPTVPQAKHGPTDIIVRCHQATGDALLAFTAIREVKKAYPKQFRFAVDTNFPDMFENCPQWMMIPASEMYNPITVEAGQCWQWINERSDHLIQEWIRGLVGEINKHAGTNIAEPRMTEFKPALYLSEREKTLPIRDIVGDDLPYWVINAGWKDDYTVKKIPTATLQTVVDALQGKVRFVEMGVENSKFPSSFHPKLKNVISAIGKTDIRRDVLRLIYHSSGVLTPISFPMHAAAALPMASGPQRLRPCVVIAGGRESTAMIQYPGQTVLSMVGKMDCCLRGGCLKVRVERKDEDILGPSQERCLRPRGDVAECMNLIKPEHIIAAIESYLVPKTPPKICLATFADDAIAQLRSISFPNKESYCKKHGYAFIGETRNFQEKNKPERPAAWHKIPMILRLMSEYDWVFWSDADSVITNPEIKLESLIDEDCDFIFCNDENGMNTGSFLIKSTEESWRMLRGAWEKTHLIGHGCFEQAAIGEWLQENVTGCSNNNSANAQDRLTIKILDQRTMNSYPSNWKPLDFILHTPRNPKWENKAECLEKALRGESLMVPKVVASEIRMRDENQLSALQSLIEKIPGNGLRGVEIGSYIGESAELFAKSGKFSEFFCIDPFKNGYDKSDVASERTPMDEVEKLFDDRTKSIPEIRKVKTTSDNASNRFKDESLDFVYIDGLHTSDGVRADIMKYKPKVKSGGVIAGHDWDWTDGKGISIGSVVKELLGEAELLNDGNWWIKVT